MSGARVPVTKSPSECRLVRGGAGFRGKQGLDYFSGISAESSGARGLCMHLLEMPPGAPAGVPHQPYNPGRTPVRALLARTDPNEQESVVLFGDDSAP